MERAELVCHLLLRPNPQNIQDSCVHVDFSNPVMFNAGFFSPIYVDNRELISYPQTRLAIPKLLKCMLYQNDLEPEGLAAIFSGGIWIATSLADYYHFEESKDIPLVIVRTEAKQHGRKRLIEGNIDPNLDYLGVEDTISSGASCIEAVRALRNAQSKIRFVICNFDYGFPFSEESFSLAGLRKIPLATFEDLMDYSESEHIHSQETISRLQEWFQDPAGWGLKNGFLPNSS